MLQVGLACLVQCQSFRLHSFSLQVVLVHSIIHTHTFGSNRHEVKSFYVESSERYACQWCAILQRIYTFCKVVHFCNKGDPGGQGEHNRLAIFKSLPPAPACVARARDGRYAEPAFRIVAHRGCNQTGMMDSYWWVCKVYMGGLG
jgi:hypothetical protein